jgi:nucleoside-diphosphate-sugar epimerase
MTVLFIGGTGNISSDCAALLHKRSHQILVLSRGQTQVPPEYRAIQADRKNPEAMRSALIGMKPDVAINFLGYELSDVEADYTLFNGSVRQYIFISSATVYEKPPRKIPVTEDAPLENRWWDYAQKKIACEHWLQERAKEGFPLTIVRPSHTYSKLWVPNPISSSSYTFASRLEIGKPVFVHDDGETPWTLTASSDFAVGLAGLVGNDKAIGEAFHITGDEVLTWNQIYAEISEAVGAKSPNIVKIPTDFICKIAPELTGNLKGDKAHAGVFDNSKIKRFVPEFQTRKPFRLGVGESVEWLRAHPGQQNLSPKVDGMIETVLAARCF